MVKVSDVVYMASLYSRLCRLFFEAILRAIDVIAVMAM
jgi:hypothetical protein